MDRSNTRHVMSQDRNLVALPLKPWNRKSSHMTNLTILRRFEFRSQLLRSGVIARDSTDSSDDVCFFIRGAPGAIEGVVGPNQVPDDYHKVCLRLSGQLGIQCLQLLPHGMTSVGSLCRAVRLASAASGTASCLRQEMLLCLCCCPMQADWQVLSALSMHSQACMCCCPITLPRKAWTHFRPVAEQSK